MATRKGLTRQWAVQNLLLSAVILLAVTTSTFATASPSRVGAAAATTSAKKITAISIPRTIAGRRLGEVLAIARANKTTTNQYTELLSQSFRAQVSLTQFVDILRSVLGASVRITKILTTTETSISVVAIGIGGSTKLDLATDADTRISGLLLSPYSNPALHKPAKTWRDLDKRIRTIAPNTAMVAAKIGDKGKCSVVHGLNETVVGPLGSMFKLYVLAAAADAVAQKGLSWDTTIKVRDDWKSLPSGRMQDEPEGTSHTVAEVANAMISISDNTATDHLIGTLGRDTVERTMVATGIANAARNQPFLTTRELFVLKGVQHPTLAARFNKLSQSEKRSLLDGDIAAVSLSDFILWTKPRDVDSVEWFASPMDICGVFGYLSEQPRRPSGTAIDRALSINDGGLKLDPETWPTVWFKGGSEPGVLTLGFYAKRLNGERAVVVMMVSNPTQAIDEQSAVLELEALTRGSFGLIR
jgi:hypothetical protein